MADVEKKPLSYQNTLNLPQTNFSIRADTQIKDPEQLIKWNEINIGLQVTQQNAGQKTFDLHDGPPYTNGHTHIGHAFNKVLKDIICKYKRMSGYHVTMQPGFDCHGLPIEFKVAAELGVEKDSKNVDPVMFKKACRAFASKWIEVQTKEFKQLGVMADWRDRYSTMDPSYEASILESFAIFVEKGYIERKGKTVPWCASCQTVLAMAEIEYQDRKDPSIFVMFPVAQAQPELAAIQAQHPDKNFGFLIWTTTPWTIPLNRAVVLNPHAQYVVIEGKGDQCYIVGKDRAEALAAKFELSGQVLAEFAASALVGSKVFNPADASIVAPIIADELVGTSEGTACLHAAPGCGPDDYLMGVKNGLEIFSPLSNDGKYTAGIVPQSLEGMAITDGQWAVLKMLSESGLLVHKENITHSYPHCWRCRGGLMFRATDQWFCNLEKNDLAKRTIQEAEKMRFIPDWGKTRFIASVGTRTEWCISRQRHWGVPIAALLCANCKGTHVSPSMIRAVAKGVETAGIEYWDTLTIDQMKSQGIIPADLACSECSSAEWKKEKDILDVWFDSGVSNYAVLRKGLAGHSFPADLYLEGSDQHRGWFQSSMLCSMIINEKPPMKSIMTHGFVVDGKRRKMSKSLGNGIEPNDIIKKYGTDVLRLWVASADAETDVVLSEDALKNLGESYRKIRNTCRFVLANLYDFNAASDLVDYENMLPVDQYALARLHRFDRVVRESYENYDFTRVVSNLNSFCVNDLSALYFDIVKDRLYVEKPDSHVRRSAQTALYHILDCMVKLMAPILSFVADDIYAHFYKKTASSVHLERFASVPEKWALDSKALTVWTYLDHMRGAVLKSIERLREVGAVKLGLEARVTLYIDKNSQEGAAIFQFLKNLPIGETQDRFLAEWLIVSSVALADFTDRADTQGLEWVSVQAERTTGVKCPRCWQWNYVTRESGLCDRCVAVLGVAE